MNFTVTNQQFLAAAFPTLDESEYRWVAGLPGDPNHVEPYLWFGRAMEQQIPPFVRPGNNNYLCISTFHPDLNGVVRRRKANFHAMHLVMVDDIGSKVEFSKLALPVSALVETSPDNFQGWYFLTHPEKDIQRATFLLERMVEYGLTADGSDPGMKGVTRYGRLPEGVNGKAKYVGQLGAPFVQKVHDWEPDRRYSVDQIADAYGLSLKAPPKPWRSTVKVPHPSRVGSLIPELVRCGLYFEPIDKAEGIHRIRCPWVHKHTDQDESGTAYFEPSEANGWHGGFKCHHGHCLAQDIQSLKHFLRAVERLSSGSQS